MGKGSGYGAIIGVGVAAILLIIIDIYLPVSPDMKRGFILAVISVIFFLIAGAAFSISWIVGVITLIVAIVLFGFAVSAFSKSTSLQTTELLPIINILRL